jgi:membrane fusion protein, copper/silver efflux system
MKMKNIFYAVFMFVLLSCSDTQKNNTDHKHQSEVTQDATTYTCSMHPQIIRDAPGTCPICGMDLVPVNKTNTPQIMLSDNQIKLANITTAKVSTQEIGQATVVNAKIVSNAEQQYVISSRAAGRIEKLFFKETGRQIRMGEPLYEIYSETLLTLQQEYLLAMEQAKIINTEKNQNYNSFKKASEKKLLLYGMTKNQIASLANTKSLTGRTTFLSPADGVITEMNVSEGQYVSEGDIIYKIENLDNLWIEAELYPNEASLVNLGQEIEVRVAGFDVSSTTASVSFLTPEYKANTQIVIVRATLNNKTFDYKPGMQAKVILKHSSKKSLAIPANAVIRDGKGTHVFVQTDQNTFEPRMVKTGVENMTQVEITEGLTEGEVLAVTGAYLLYSDLILKGIQPHDHH